MSSIHMVAVISMFLLVYMGASNTSYEEMKEVVLCGSPVIRWFCRSLYQ